MKHLLEQIKLQSINRASIHVASNEHSITVEEALGMSGNVCPQWWLI